MPFDEVTCKLLAYYTAHHPGTVDQWYGPWNTILTTLFPPTAGYVVTPQRKDYIEHSAPSHIPDFIMEVTKVDGLNLNMRVVLIFEIKNSQHSPNAVDQLFRQLDRQISRVLSDSACDKMYWIAAIGSHWVYGVKEDGLDGGSHELTPLIEWHDTTHDDASFADLQTLAALVQAI